MNREERLRRQKDFLTGFAFWVVWLVILWVVLKAAGSVLFPFLAAFAVAVLLSGSGTVYCGADAYSKRDRGGRGRSFLLYYFSGIPLFCGQLSGASDLRYGKGIIRIFFRYDRPGHAALLPVVRPLCFCILSDRTDRKNIRFTWSWGRVRTDTEKCRKTDVGNLGWCHRRGVRDGGRNPGIFMKLLIAVIATVFMELEFPEIKAFLKRQIPAEYQRAFRDGKNYVTGTMGKCILSYCLIFGITFAELTAGLFLLGIKNAFAIAFIIAVLDIPFRFLGTGTVFDPVGGACFCIGKNFCRGRRVWTFTL